MFKTIIDALRIEWTGRQAKVADGGVFVQELELRNRIGFYTGLYSYEVRPRKSFLDGVPIYTYYHTLTYYWDKL